MFLFLEIFDIHVAMLATVYPSSTFIPY